MNPSSPKSVGLVVLGCDKNTVDSEYLAAALARRGAIIVPLPALDDPPDAVVITSCGFTDEARRQTIDTILAWAERKSGDGRPQTLYVWSCMAQQWADELLESIPELDGVAGVGGFDQLADAVLSPDAEAPARLVNRTPAVEVVADRPRLRLDALPYSFLKIADGCDHRCAFCAIPRMKGPLRSAPREILLDEARALIDSGARELNLIAQDTAAYGRDLYDDYRLSDLLEQLLALEGDFWLRLLYVYPGGLTDRLTDLLSGHPKLCPYIDLPLQHLDPGVLRKMRRPDPDLDVERRIDELRERIPDLAVRTTMLVGFPGEDRAAFQRLLDTMRRIRFDWLGAFVFSPEEATEAFDMSGRPSETTAKSRYDLLMREQAKIAAELSVEQIGETRRVLIEAPTNQEGIYAGRSEREAPEVDGCVFVESPTPLSPGQFVTARIIAADVYDLFAEPLTP